MDEPTLEQAYVDPDRARFAKFKELPRQGVIQMLNLVCFNQVANYPEGAPEMGASGRAAYANYGRESGPIFRRLGGKIIWSGAFQLTLIGPEDEIWDAIFIAEYPNAEAFISMIRDPNYQRAVRHRQAAVKTSRLIRLAPADAGAGFG